MSTGVRPRHVAIIMDGNGRWAQDKGLARTQGHQQGAKRAADVIETALEAGVEILTLFAFSTENFLRPAEEVNFLFSLLSRVIERHLSEYVEKGVWVRCIGDRSRLPTKLTTILSNLPKPKNVRLILNLALAYGGRWDIVQATKKIAQAVQDGTLQPSEITESLFSEQLSLQGLIEPDLLIRTSGVVRLSNFLLWDLSYSELYFTDQLWPDFDRNSFLAALDEFESRERRFGCTSEYIETPL